MNGGAGPSDRSPGLPRGPGGGRRLKREGLSPQERLRRKRDFDRVFRQGKRFHDAPLRYLYCGNSLGHSRLGIVVGRKVGKAVLRNRVKRLVREVFRKGKGSIPRPLDIVVLPQKACPDLSHAAVASSFERFLGALGRRRGSAGQ